MMLQTHEVKRVARAILFMAFGGAVTLLMDSLIRRYFPERIILKDLMFMVTPHIPQLSLVADGIIALSFALTVLFFSKGRAERLAQFFFAFGVMLTIRGILNFVTPIGDPSGDSETFGFLERKPLLGMFPSGHVAALTLEYYLITHWGWVKKWQMLFLLFIVLESIALWVTRGHYTIDIVGGLALGYFASKAAKNYA